MEKVFFVRLMPGKGQRGPAFGGDRYGETCLALSPGGTVLLISCSPDAGAFIGTDGDGTVILRDDGGNVLHRYRGMHGKGDGSEFALFPLGRFLCGLSTGSDLMVPEHARCLSLAGSNLLLVFPLPGESGTAPFEAVARTRAVENRMFVVLADSYAPPAAFGPDGRDVLPVPVGNGGAEFRLSGDLLSQEGYEQIRRKDLYYSLTAL